MSRLVSPGCCFAVPQCHCQYADLVILPCPLAPKPPVCSARMLRCCRSSAVEQAALDVPPDQWVLQSHPVHYVPCNLALSCLGGQYVVTPLLSSLCMAYFTPSLTTSGLRWLSASAAALPAAHCLSFRICVHLTTMRCCLHSARNVRSHRSSDGARRRRRQRLITLTSVFRRC